MQRLTKFKKEIFTLVCLLIIFLAAMVTFSVEDKKNRVDAEHESKNIYSCHIEYGATTYVGNARYDPLVETEDHAYIHAIAIVACTEALEMCIADRKFGWKDCMSPFQQKIEGIVNEIDQEYQ